MNDTTASLETAVVSRVAEQLRLDPTIAGQALQLIEEGKPIPYLARYRREDVGGLDERDLRILRDEAELTRQLEQRREFILRAIGQREDVPEKMRRRIERCTNRLELEYLYEPYRPPRKTPGTVARERGLEPLAEAWLRGEAADAAAYVSAEKGVDDEDAARGGAIEILAERFATVPDVRYALLRVVEKEGVLQTAPPPGKNEIGDRWRQFRTFEERLARIPSHRFLALRRGEKEGALSLRVSFPDEKVRAMIEQRFFPKAEEVAEDARTRLGEAAALAVRFMHPAIVDDALHALRDRAEGEAISVFAKNLEDLLLFPPAGPHRVMGIDPAPRGAIPFACVDENGNHIDHARLKLFAKEEDKAAQAREEVLGLLRKHGIQLVALGNGQGRHQVGAWLTDLLAQLGDEDVPPVVVVNEVGVGAYASGPVGRSECGAMPVPVRAALSLARRLIDPLPELVKVDPRQIGVGQYQHDVDAARLGRVLEDVVQHCACSVGVDVNRAPSQLLAAVCGVTLTAARLIVEHREKHGRIPARVALQELGFLSETAFEYAAGFLRVYDAERPLDGTGVHPRSYPLVERLAATLGTTPEELVGNADRIPSVVAEEHADERFSPAQVAGVLFELLEAGRDPRATLEIVRRPAGVRSSKDLQAGMQLNGRVTNVTNFGAFVDIGVQQDGLVHVSELADHFVKDPTTVVKVGEVVTVRVLGVEAETGRISLSMKSQHAAGHARRGERGGERGGGHGGERGRGGQGRGGRRAGPGGGGRGGSGGGAGRGGRRRDRRETSPDEATPEEIARETAAPAEEPVQEAQENPVPADMSEEEFMKRKLEELRRRFG